MKNLLYVLLLVTGAACAPSQKRSEDPHSWTEDQVNEWFEEKQWLGATNMQPDPSINKRELAVQYQRHKHRWDTAFAFIRKQDFAGLTVGDHPLDGREVFVRVSEYNSKNPEDAFYEAHKDYADIHFLVSGEERIGVADLSAATVRTPYDEEKDIEFYEPVAGKEFLAKPGTFFIFFPGEGHRPGMKVENNAPVKKIVIKVKC
jgi:YhcH/YjgK/YiaL family protein